MQSTGKRSGFTLIELLTVIAVIAILMGLLFPALNAAKNAAKKAQAKNDLTQFVTAVNHFYTDYGVYPISTTGTSDVEYGGTSETHNQDVVNVLRADTSAADTLASGTTPISINTRMVVYLDLPFVKNINAPKNGLGTGTETGGNGKAGDWYDPWGNTYIIGIDANYDGYVQGGLLEGYNSDANGVNYVSLSGSNAVQSGCVAGSFGADGKQGTAGNKEFIGTDDILSWQ